MRAPPWLARVRLDDPAVRPEYIRAVKYYRRLYRAWPEWCRDDPAFRRIYREASRLRRAGLDVQVDHIVPITSALVSGLHVPWNLQIIRRRANLEKSNRVWPNSPHENGELFGAQPPHQMALL